VACDILWFYNKAFHDGVSFEARNVSAHINKIAIEHFQAWISVSVATVEKWIHPAPNWIKINFDTAIRDSFLVQATLCRSSDGNIIHMASLISPPFSLNMGEALVAQLAISVNGSLNLDQFILEGDFEVVIQAINFPFSNQDWRISPVIMSSLKSIPSNSLWEARKINRNANFCAHSMARCAAARSYFGSILISISFRSPDSGFDPSFSFM
jgi:hypothetical protein